MAWATSPRADKMKAVIYKVGPVNDQYQPTYPGITNRYRYPKAIAASTVIYMSGICASGGPAGTAVAGDILTQFDGGDHVIMVGNWGCWSRCCSTRVGAATEGPGGRQPAKWRQRDGAEDDLLPSVEVEAAAGAAAAAAGKVTIDADWTFMGVTTRWARSDRGDLRGHAGHHNLGADGREDVGLRRVETSGTPSARGPRRHHDASLYKARVFMTFLSFLSFPSLVFPSADI